MNFVRATQTFLFFLEKSMVIYERSEERYRFTVMFIFIFLGTLFLVQKYSGPYVYTH